MPRVGVRKLKNIITDKVFTLYFQKGLRFDQIYLARDEKEEYKEFLKLLCTAHGKFTYDVIDQKDCAEALGKYFTRIATVGCYRNKTIKRKMDEWKSKRAMGENFLDPINEVVLTETKQDVIYNEDGTELVRTITKEITQKRIERIEFHSPSTIDAMRIAEQTQQCTNEYFSDLVLKLQGKKTNKHQFVHLDIAGKVKNYALDILEQMDHALASLENEEELKAINKKIAQVNKFAKLADGVRKMEMQPLYTMNLIHETGRNRQAEISQAITNDRQMLDFGNVILKQDEKLATDRNKIRSELKEKGFVNMDQILIENLKNIGAYKQEEEKIEAMTDEEVEDDDDLNIEFKEEDDFESIG